MLVNPAKYTKYEILQATNLFVKSSKRRENQNIAFNVRLLLTYRRSEAVSTVLSLEAKPLGPGYCAVEATVDIVITPM